MTADKPDGSAESLHKTIRKLERQLKRNERSASQLENLSKTKEKLLETLMAELDTEKKRSESLLRNILPTEIIDRLNDGEVVIADRYEQVSVVFSDFIGFTAISANLDPTTLVESLNLIFSKFDELSQDLGVEKIKTIGDAYLAVAGVPGERSDHASAIADMALGMIAALKDANESLDAEFRIRIGVATGPAVAGIIGTHKFVYDVWGDTVNVASRLETTSEPGRIQISERTAEILGDHFIIESRGQIELKGKGMVPTFYLIGRA